MQDLGRGINALIGYTILGMQNLHTRKGFNKMYGEISNRFF